MRRTRVLLVSRNYPPLLGGMERLNHHMLLELNKAHDTYLVGPRGAENYVPQPERASLCPSSPIHWFLLCAIFKAFRLARCLRPGLIIAGSGVNAIPAWFAAKASGAPWIVYLHGLDIVVDNYWYQRIFLPIIRRADGWFANSHATARLAIDAGIDAKRLHVLHPGVEIPETFPTDEAIRSWREKCGLGNRPLMLSVGRLTRRKGLKEFILRALPIILEAQPDALLVVVGEEPKTALTSSSIGVEALYQAASQTNTNSSLRVLGKLTDEELALAYHAASVLVFPVLDIQDDMEGFGMVAIEAAAHGLPTVAFDVGGIADAILPGSSGELISSGDYRGMADSVITQLEKGKGAAKSATCRNFAANFSWNRFGEKLRQYCQSLIRIEHH